MGWSKVGKESHLAMPCLGNSSQTKDSDKKKT